MNGGLAVDGWGATSLEGCYAVGEAAGTHGVTRPGGAALNAGQVFGTRCAEHVAARRGARAMSALAPGLIDEAVARILDVLKADSPLTVKAIRKDVQDRMSDHAAILCNAADVKQALAAARELNETIRQQGIACSGAPEALKALQWRQIALLSEAVLTALAFYIGRGGGSRGARAICAPDGDRVPEARIGVLEDVRFVSERAADRAEQIHVRFDSERFVCEARPIRRRDREDKPFFERDWPDFLAPFTIPLPQVGREIRRLCAVIGCHAVSERAQSKEWRSAWNDDSSDGSALLVCRHDPHGAASVKNVDHDLQP